MRQIRRRTIREATGAGPIMLGDIADDLAGIHRKFSQYFPYLEREFDNPYLDSALSTILTNIASLVRECRAGTISLEASSDSAVRFRDLAGKMVEVMNFIQQEDPNLVVVIQIFSESLQILQSIANMVSSRVGLAKTKASGAVDYAMFGDIIDLLNMLGELVDNEPAYTSNNETKRYFGRFRRMAENLFRDAQDGLTVEQTSRALMRIMNDVSSFKTLESYGAGLVAGIQDQILRLVRDLQLPEEEAHRATFPNLPRVRSLGMPTDDDDYNE